MSFSYCPQCATKLEPWTDPVGEVARAACPDCDWVHYDNPTPVVAGIVQMGEDVILVRNVGWPDTWFGLVSGFLEKDETPADGIVREVAEELGVGSQVVELIGVYPFSQMNQVIIAYHLTASGELVLGDELEEFKRVPVDQLKPWPFGTGAAVKDWLEARTSPDQRPD